MPLTATLLVLSLANVQGAGWKIAKVPLVTRWSRAVSPTNALPEYPRPTLARKAWMNLNGLWDLALTPPESAAPQVYDRKILVPYPMESALSGLALPTAPDKRLWYRRSVTIPAAWKGQRVRLNFGAANWEASVSVNGTAIGSHKGGFDSFSFDVTDALKDGANEIVVGVRNPMNVDHELAQVVGKQRLKPGGIFYTAASGIWQTVWMEPVSRAHIARVRTTPDVDAGELRVTPEVEGVADAAGVVEIIATEGGREVARTQVIPGTEARLGLPKPKLWTPERPFLYGLRLRYIEGGRTMDAVESYGAMRKVALGTDAQGRRTILLNGQPVFQVGALDQGYWPDGIWTAPTDEALRYDIEAAKRLGFNLLRKHAKVEPERWYHHADRLGVLVWQDMPQAFGAPREGVEGGFISDEGKAQWDAEWRRILAQFANHPSIVVWTTFNEGMGQHDTERIVNLTKSLDPTRLVNHASGWFEKGLGDIADRHEYPGPGVPEPDERRAVVNGEFGGITRRVPGHVWTNDLFGYGALVQDDRLVTKRYQALLKRAYELRETRGMSAAVYTQITDVEQETNGLLTYDRARFKADARIVAAANRGTFLPVPPNPNPDLLPTSQEDPYVWRYRTENPGEGWNAPGYDDSAWTSGPAPFGHDVGGAATDWSTPELWVRREVTLPKSLPKDLVLRVFHDEDVEIWINGVLAASATGYTSDYVSLPLTPEGRAALRPGKNLIAARVRQTRGGQFFDLGIAKAGR